MLILAHPQALWLLAALPVLLLLGRRRGKVGLGVADIAPVLAVGPLGLVARLPLACRVLGLVAAIFALAGPALRDQSTVYRGRGADIMLAIDLSESMAAMDIGFKDRTVTRLEAATQAAARLAADRPGDRIGLVAFGGRAYVVMPPSADRSALTDALARLSVGAAGRQTALGDAVGLAVKRLLQAPGLSRAVVLLSDGGSNAGELRPETAAEAAAARGIPVFALGLGTDGPVPFLVNHPLLGQRIVHEKAPVNVAELGEVARATGGTFARAGDGETLEKAIQDISARIPTDMTPVATPETLPLAPLSLALAVCLLTLAAGLGATRCLRLP